MNELNWLSIGITALLSFIGALVGAYLSFVFKKKEKKFEYQLELEKRIVNELKVPIYELEKNLSSLKFIFEMTNTEGVLGMIRKDSKELLSIGESVSKSAEEAKRIIMLNAYYLKQSTRGKLIEEIEKISSLDAFSKAIVMSKNDDEPAKRLLEKTKSKVYDYNSANVHNTLPKLF